MQRRLWPATPTFATRYCSHVVDAAWLRRRDERFMSGAPVRRWALHQQPLPPRIRIACRATSILFAVGAEACEVALAERYFRNVDERCREVLRVS
jgi:hypothetical protein